MYKNILQRAATRKFRLEECEQNDKDLQIYA